MAESPQQDAPLVIRDIIAISYADSNSFHDRLFPCYRQIFPEIVLGDSNMVCSSINMRPYCLGYKTYYAKRSEHLGVPGWE